ncbi:MAG: hypothetical protein BWY31_00454 [Lentisphaerae bacterium ADurb.Bin242]|nr:MAG: hypothetical protein BWY31_00454 [Lentisphaerae bacterium ADurb.Bin242]
MTKCGFLFLVFLGGLCSGKENRILNGDFQSKEGEFPLYWMFRSHSNGTAEHFSSGGPDGKSFLRLRSTEGAFRVEQRNLKLIPGESYKLSGFFRTRNVKDPATGVFLEKEKGIQNLPADCPEWQYREVQLSVQGDTVGVRICVDRNGGELDVAGLKLLPIEGKDKGRSLTQRENREPAFVPLSNLRYLSPHSNRLSFYWAGIFPADPDKIECVFSFDRSAKTIRRPFGDGEVTLDLNGIGLGEDVLTARVLEKETGREFHAGKYEVRMLDIPPLPSSLKRLNNLVTEIFHGKVRSGEEVILPNPRYGWMFFRYRGESPAPFEAVLDGKKILDEKSLRGETARLLEPGKYTLKINGSPGTLTVRLIPDILNFPLGSSRWPGNGRYDWTFAKKYMLPALTTIDVGGASPEERAELKSMGLQWFSNFGVLNPKKKNDRADLLERLGASGSYTDPQYDGMTLDETEYRDAPALDPYAWALREFKNPRNIPLHSWVIGPPSPSYANFISAAINVSGGRGRILYEVYNRGQRTEREAEDYLRQMPVHAGIYRAIAPDIFAQNLSIILGNFSENPSISLASFPHVDFKYYLEMQVRLLAADPAFRGLGGVGWWGTHAANEEIVRWSFALMKHYAVEGRADSLSARYGFRYAPGHVKNPDFEEGLTGWQANSLVRTGTFKGFGEKSEKRYGSVYHPGDMFAILARTPDGHAELRQTVTGLVRGKTYSLTFFTADANDMKNHVVAPRRHKMEYELGDVEILRRVCAVDYRKARDEKDTFARINAYRIIFRAEKEEAGLVFRNKTAEPGAELALNYVSVMPYFEP